jgi:CheY-like chemotaxis protein
VLRALRTDPRTALIPVLVLTSLPKTNEQKLVNDGATAYCEKSELVPDKGGDVLVAEIEKMLHRVRAAKA